MSKVQIYHIVHEQISGISVALKFHGQWALGKKKLMKIRCVLGRSNFLKSLRNTAMIFARSELGLYSPPGSWEVPWNVVRPLVGQLMEGSRGWGLGKCWNCSFK